MVQAKLVEASATFIFAYKENKDGEKDREIIELSISREHISTALNYICTCLFAAERQKDTPQEITKEQFTATYILSLLLGMLVPVIEGKDFKLERNTKVVGLIFPIPAPIARHIIDWLKLCVAETVVAHTGGMAMIALANEYTGRSAGVGLIDELVHVADGGVRVIDNTTDDTHDPDPEATVASWFDS